MPIQVNPLLAADDVVVALHRGLGSANHSLSAIPASIQVVIRDRVWEHRIIRVTGQHAQFRSFTEFVTAPPLAGLGTTVEHLRDICRRDPEALDAIDRASQNAVGRPEKSVDNINEIEERPTGTAAAQALRRLRKDRPDLHAEVLAGDKSPHAAMVEAGFRARTITIPIERLDAVAATLCRHLGDDQRRRLAALLLGNGSSSSATE